MSYSYTTERPSVFTEEGTDKLLRIRDFIRTALKTSGAVRAQEMLEVAGSGSSWKNMALIDYLVARGDLHCVYQDGAWQHRIYVGRDNQL